MLNYTYLSFSLSKVIEFRPVKPVDADLSWKLNLNLKKHLSFQVSGYTKASVMSSEKLSVQSDFSFRSDVTKCQKQSFTFL